MDNKTKVKVRGEEERVIREFLTEQGSVYTEGDYILAGDNITKGPLDPKDILRLNGVEGVYQYLLKEVQRVYKQQGVDINDKHVEVIVGQMLSETEGQRSGRHRICCRADSTARSRSKRLMKLLSQNGGRPAEAEHILLGITKASLATNSFLSAASFQETTRVLTDAAIKGKNDTLQGLKENVIIGKLIPGRYRHEEVSVP